MHDPATDWRERLRALREEIGGLVADLPGPVAALTVRVGDCSLEIAWGPPSAASERAAPPRDAPSETERDGDLRVCTAPLVGTFYVAPGPGEPPFVRVGDRVEKGQAVGVVEAMKLMNRVVAECSGEVVEVRAADGTPVEFGQELVFLRPDGGPEAGGA
ncbi:acetyl-CoA carboxylase biotin carboxyl carrier protein [Thermomonospora umbrina]|uniref:Biotin carboxyl carrier protein of acetyl-CoA carboxylase n=1 Tax=Thermomonospora umbrina TaxID=111806 RepID=A0A3D9SNM4_9ACTN|nr:biotin/lipoyl-containing protein [Thermomonospora umbrina]REE97576.1 acetyl-CoA carboxylase biotin carboxyl carrier protein [Thermomonospora umbrina]